MIANRNHVSLGATLMLAAACSCATTGPIARSYVAPAADELLATLRQRHATLTTLNMVAKTTSSLNGERVKATVLMLVDRRGRLRFDVEVSLQGTVASLASDGSNFALHDRHKPAFFIGPACPANIARLIPVPLQPTEIAAILFGDAPLPEGARATTVGWDDKLGADVLAIESGANRLWVTLRRRPAAPGSARAAEVDIVAVAGQAAGASGQWRASYQDFENVAGIRAPTLIRFADVGRSFDDGVEMKIRERTINATLADAAFRLGAPVGQQVQVLPCPAPPGP